MEGKRTHTHTHTASSQKLLISTRSLTWKRTYRHITSDDVKSTRRPEFAAELDMIHILKKKRGVFRSDNDRGDDSSSMKYPEGVLG